MLCPLKTEYKKVYLKFTKIINKSSRRNKYQVYNKYSYHLIRCSTITLVAKRLRLDPDLRLNEPQRCSERGRLEKQVTVPGRNRTPVFQVIERSYRMTCAVHIHELIKV